MWVKVSIFTFSLVDDTRLMDTIVNKEPLEKARPQRMPLKHLLIKEVVAITKVRVFDHVPSCVPHSDT